MTPPSYLNQGRGPLLGMFDYSECACVNDLLTFEEDCSPGRPVPAMHILEQGIVMKAGRVLKPHAVLGMEMLVSQYPTFRGVVCLTHVMTMSISREMYMSLVRHFPSIAQALRRNALKDRVREGV